MEGETDSDSDETFFSLRFNSGPDQKPIVKTEDNDLTIKAAQNGKTETKVVQISLATLFAIQNAEDSSNPSSAANPLIIPSCDCISVRSNSTTSTQSFAFPVLAPEFYASPAKMAQGDTRFLKKRRRWKKYCFGFCKF